MLCKGKDHGDMIAKCKCIKLPKYPSQYLAVTKPRLPTPSFHKFTKIEIYLMHKYYKFYLIGNWCLNYDMNTTETRVAQHFHLVIEMCKIL